MGFVSVAVLGRNRSEPESLLAAVAAVDVAGSGVAWPVLWNGPSRRVSLPSYVFERRRYWLDSTNGRNVSGLGLSGSDHPLIGAVVQSPGSGGVIVTGRLSVAGLGWLADHVVSGVVLVPGTGFVELVMRAADEVGCVVLRELTLLAPLRLPASGGVQVQVVVAGVGEQGERAVAVYARPEADRSDVGLSGDWTVHAEGIVAPADPATSGVDPADATRADLAQWPPTGADAVDLAGLYDRLADAGYGYGPVFQGLRALWRRGDELFVEATLPESDDDATRYGLHPALLDAVLHGMAVRADGVAASDGEGGRGPWLPFAWQDVILHAAGATSLRAHISPRAGGDAAPGAVRIYAVDGSGEPVFTAGSLSTRPLQSAGAVTPGDPLLSINWLPNTNSMVVQAIPRTARFSTVGEYREWTTGPQGIPSIAVFDLRSMGTDDGAVGRMRALTHATLAVVQAWLGDSRFGGGRLVVLTAGAVSVAGERVSDLAGAAVWGLVR
ncbi:polyketide synthase dehydratase domain-containing protein, partial [Nocardia sp. NPDC051052]|uniref:polyketide synthase dehydratase domain-containing protein n=1 Tax=Nocardia sp. NPDC051052 TaxID=3364322 RepID=UPI0037B60F5D